VALVNLPVPLVAAINGPALVHADIPLMGDIVVASETATLRDFHLPGGLVPGGIAQVVWQELLGPVRANYFLLTGQTLSAAEALSLGVVNEVLLPESLLSRAHEHAGQLARLTPLVRRAARQGINQRLQKRLAREAPYGYALIGLGALDASLQAKAKQPVPLV
jgi:enoyl-CoA hydratase/carnithine racemase